MFGEALVDQQHGRLLTIFRPEEGEKCYWNLNEYCSHGKDLGTINGKETVQRVPDNCPKLQPRMERAKAVKYADYFLFLPSDLS